MILRPNDRPGLVFRQSFDKAAGTARRVVGKVRDGIDKRGKISVWNDDRTEYYHGDANTKEFTCYHGYKESEPKLTLTLWDIRRDTFDEPLSFFVGMQSL